MADQEKKVVLNVPGQENVSPTDRTQEAPAFKDPLSVRDTDTGSLDMMADTRTRKTVKLKPVASPGFIPKMNLSGDDSAGIDANVSQENVVDPLEKRDTDTDGLNMLDNTRTRKTVKLSPVPPLGSGPVVEDSIPAAPSDTVANEPVVDPLEQRDTDTDGLNMLNDTRTRKTMKLSPIPVGDIKISDVTASVPAAPVEIPVAESTEQRAGETDDLNMLNDTRTRKTMKLSSVPVDGEIAVVEKAAPKAAGTIPQLKPIMLKPAAGISLTAGQKTVAPVLTPVAKTPVPGVAPEAIKSGETGELGMLEDSQTRKTIKLTSTGTESPALEPIKDPLAARDSDTGNVQKVLDETQTRKTIKLKPLEPKPAGMESLESGQAATPPIATAQHGLDPQKTIINPMMQASKEAGAEEEKLNRLEIDDTVKIQRPGTNTASESPTPDAATQGKAVLGAKQTIKLRPSTAGGGEGEENMKSSESSMKLAPSSSSKATIRLTPESATSSAPALAPASKLSPSAPTLNLKPPVATEEKKADEQAVPAMPKLGGLKLGKKSEEPTGEQPPASADAPPAVEGETKKGGLSIKKAAADAEEPKGPPRVQKDQEKIAAGASGRKAAASEASLLYTCLAVVTLIILAASVAITVIQYANHWEQQRVGKKIEIPYLSDLVK